MSFRSKAAGMASRSAYGRHFFAGASNVSS